MGQSIHDAREGGTPPGGLLVLFPGALGDFLCALPAIIALRQAWCGPLRLIVRPPLGQLVQLPETRLLSMDRPEIANLFSVGAPLSPATHRLLGGADVVHSWTGDGVPGFEERLRQLGGARVALHPFRGMRRGEHAVDYYARCVGLAPASTSGFIVEDESALNYCLRKSLCGAQISHPANVVPPFEGGTSGGSHPQTSPSPPPSGTVDKLGAVSKPVLSPVQGGAVAGRSTVPSQGGGIGVAARLPGLRAWPALRQIEGSRVLVLHPGSGSPRKNWEGFDALAERWHARHGSLAVAVHGPAEDERGAPELRHARTVSGLSLPAVAALLRRCRLFVGNDGGIAHLAAAVGAPGIVLFGPSDPATWGPRSDSFEVLLAAPTCATCGPERFCAHRLSVDVVMDAVGAHPAMRNPLRPPA
jgi:hypothetical protein